MPIVIKSERQRQIDEKYVGFAPQTTAVKPVHIANGLFRSLMGETFDTEQLNRFVFWQKHSGEIPRGHDLDTVFKSLIDAKRIDIQEVKKDDVKRLRVLLKGILDADSGVFMHRDRMESYSAGYKGFLSEDRIAQDGGELIAEWLKVRGSPLIGYIQRSLTDESDAITALCSPLIGDRLRSVACTLEPDLLFLYRHPDLPDVPRKLWDGLAASAATLNEHLLEHPNKLFGLRLVTLYASFVLVRHLSCLESYYVPGAETNLVPFLLDFSDNPQDPVARASQMSYTLICQSISRFYSWAFTQRLQQIATYQDLLQESEPVFDTHLSVESKEIWQVAVLEARDAQDPYAVMGEALFDAMVQDGEGDPIRYLRQLGRRSGLLYPPVNTYPYKRFIVEQDMLEVLLRGVLQPHDSVNLDILQERLWEHYGIIIGGRVLDEERLLDMGIHQADSTALKANQDRFAERLNSLDFAQLLADGVLQVTLGV